MQTRERIHVAPLGFEFDRVLEPAKQYRADRVILLEFIAPDIEKPPYHDDLPEALEAAGIDCEQRECNIFDLYESIAAIARIATEHEQHNVYVNLSSGSKITAIAGMIACMATGAAEPYYVRAETYASDPSRPVTTGMEKSIEIPTYPMEQPDAQHMAILDYIQSIRDNPENTKAVVSKQDLIGYAEAANLRFIRTYDGETQKGKYQLLKRHIIDPLQEKGYITVESVGVRKDVQLTEEGRNTLRAFRYLVEE